MKKIRGYKDILDVYCELFKNHPEIEKVTNVKPFTNHHIVIQFKGGMVGDFRYMDETNWKLVIVPEWTPEQLGGEADGTV